MFTKAVGTPLGKTAFGARGLSGDRIQSDNCPK